MVGSLVAGVRVNATGVTHKAAVRIKVGRDGSARQQGFADQVVDLLGVGMGIAGDVDVFAW